MLCAHVISGNKLRKQTPTTTFEYAMNFPPFCHHCTVDFERGTKYICIGSYHFKSTQSDIFLPSLDKRSSKQPFLQIICPYMFVITHFKSKFSMEFLPQLQLFLPGHVASKVLGERLMYKGKTSPCEYWVLCTQNTQIPELKCFNSFNLPCRNVLQYQKEKN